MVAKVTALQCDFSSCLGEELVKKPLKKEQPRKSRQELIERTKEFIEFMDIVREDFDQDDGTDEHDYVFSAHLPDHDSARRLAEMFERSGMDYRAPGHWQFMLVAMCNFFLDETPTRVATDWTRDDKYQFLTEIAQLEAKHGKTNRLSLCKMLREQKPKQYPADPDSLRVQLQKILREFREDLEIDALTPKEKKLLRAFDRK